MKNLAQVCKVKEVRHHSNADRLDVVRVKGWEVIVGRDEYKVGDLVIYIQPDAILTDNFIDRFKLTYLRGANKNRVKTIKLRGEYSQGLVITPDIPVKVGKDLTEYYGIKKWEPKESFLAEGGKVRRTRQNQYGKLFPKYTKIENIKNFPDVLKEGERVVITEKLHGTNFRCGWVPTQKGKIRRFFMRLLGKPEYDFVVGSHNVVTSNDPNTASYHGNNIYAEIALQLKDRIPYGYVVYGEIFGRTGSGKAIQKNYSYGKNDLEVRLFDVKYRDEYLGFDAFSEFVDEHVFERVYILFVGQWKPELIDVFASGMSAIDEHTVREGFVVKPIKERTDNRVNRVIFKAISTEYLTQKKKTTERH